MGQQHNNFPLAIDVVIGFIQFHVQHCHRPPLSPPTPYHIHPAHATHSTKSSLPHPQLPLFETFECALPFHTILTQPNIPHSPSPTVPHSLWTHPLHNITHPAQHTTLTQSYFATFIMDTLTQSYFATLTIGTLTVDSATPCLQQCII